MHAVHDFVVFLQALSQWKFWIQVYFFFHQKSSIIYWISIMSKSDTNTILYRIVKDVIMNVKVVWWVFSAGKEFEGALKLEADISAPLSDFFNMWSPCFIERIQWGELKWCLRWNCLWLKSAKPCECNKGIELYMFRYIWMSKIGSRSNPELHHVWVILQNPLIELYVHTHDYDISKLFIFIICSSNFNTLTCKRSMRINKIFMRFRYIEILSTGITLVKPA